MRTCSRTAWHLHDYNYDLDRTDNFDDRGSEHDHHRVADNDNDNDNSFWSESGRNRCSQRLTSGSLGCSWKYLDGHF